MIYVILGKTNSGKTTFVKNLSKKLGIKQTITCTTRPPRKGEIDGNDYYFLSKETAENLKKSGKFIEYVEYKVANGDKWLYGTRFTDIDTSINQIIILNPHGYREIKKMFGDLVVGIYINPPVLTRIKRIFKRDKGNYKEAIRRFFADEKDFKNIDDVIEVKKVCKINQD